MLLHQDTPFLSEELKSSDMVCSCGFVLISRNGICKEIGALAQYTKWLVRQSNLVLFPPPGFCPVYCVYPKYAPPQTNTNKTSLMNVHPHPELFGLLLNDPLLGLEPVYGVDLGASLGVLEYRLLVSTFMMSKLSVSSPVSPLKPR